MQMMIAVFDFPAKGDAATADHVPLLAVDHVRGTSTPSRGAQRRGPAIRCSAMSQTRRRVVAGLAALAAGTAAAYAVCGPAAVGASAPSTAAVTAVDFDWSMPGATDYTATIAAGGSVTFSYPAGVSIHNVDFTGGGPTACTQTAGATVGPVSPLPAVPEAPGWSGTCRFDTPGTYLFVCDNHNYMKGTIVVEGRGTTTTTTSSSTTAGTSTAPADQTPGAGSSTPAAPRRRPRVRGSAWLTASAARCCAAR